MSGAPDPRRHSAHTVEEWVAACAARGLELKSSGKEYSGPCPLCDGTDRFHIRPGDKVDVLASCRHGCTFEQLCKAVFGDRRHGAASRQSDVRRFELASQGPGQRSQGARQPARHESAASPVVRDSSSLPRLLWAAAETADPSTARVYLCKRRAWPPDGVGPRLPRTVRWLSAAAAPSAGNPRSWPGLPSGAAGAILFAFRPPGILEAPPTAVSAEALDADGNRLRRRWRRTFGQRFGSVFQAVSGPGAIRVVEGEVSALAALWLYPGETIRAVGGTAGMRPAVVADLDLSRPVVIEADGDATGRTAAWKLERHLIDEGRQVRVDERGGRIGQDAADDLAELVAEALAMTGGNDPAAAWARIQGG